MSSLAITFTVELPSISTPLKFPEITEKLTVLYDAPFVICTPSSLLYASPDTCTIASSEVLTPIRSPTTTLLVVPESVISTPSPVLPEMTL